jgi:hypothetical protein
MKKLLTTILLLLCVTVFAQQIKPIVLKPIGEAEYFKHLPPISIVSPPASPPNPGAAIHIKTKVKTYVFKSHNSAQLYIYVGDLNTMPVAVVRSMNEKQDRYYLINKNTGVIDTLFSLPIFYTDHKKFATIGGADLLGGGKQLIQIGQMVAGRFKVTTTLKPTIKLYMSYLFWANQNTFYLSDKNTAFYQVELKK